jgi:metal-sulfur cluster biosynthetic enzyme
MDTEMIRKIDRALSRVKEPETLLSVLDLGLVGRVTYSRTWNKFIVRTAVSSPRPACAMCGLIAGAIRETLMRRLEEEFRSEFPGSGVLVIQDDAEDGTESEPFSLCRSPKGTS